MPSRGLTLSARQLVKILARRMQIESSLRHLKSRHYGHAFDVSTACCDSVHDGAMRLGSLPASALRMKAKLWTVALLVCALAGCALSTEALAAEVQNRIQEKFKSTGITIESLVVSKKGGNVYS